jgi:hypothetical protein
MLCGSNYDINSTTLGNNVIAEAEQFAYIADNIASRLFAEGKTDKATQIHDAVGDLNDAIYSMSTNMQVKPWSTTFSRDYTIDRESHSVYAAMRSVRAMIKR